jgi:hypothetical protein
MELAPQRLAIPVRRTIPQQCAALRARERPLRGHEFPRSKSESGPEHAGCPSEAEVHSQQLNPEPMSLFSHP